VLLNANSAIFQLYHGENKLIFNEMVMRSAFRIGGIMVSVLASSVIDRGFELRSGQTKDYKIGTCFSALRSKSKDWFGSESGYSVRAGPTTKTKQVLCFLSPDWFLRRRFLY
jgi:hypothetical protein